MDELPEFTWPVYEAAGDSISRSSHFSAAKCHRCHPSATSGHRGRLGAGIEIFKPATQQPRLQLDVWRMR
jgi:hypothetical protein